MLKTQSKKRELGLLAEEKASQTIVWHGVGHARGSDSEPGEVSVKEDIDRLGTKLTTHPKSMGNSAAEPAS